MITNLTGFESSFFSAWRTWDEVGAFAIGFYQPVLKEGVGLDLYVGLVDYAILDGQYSTLSLYDKDGHELAVIPVKLTLAPRTTI